jgi:hypothetical protein
MALGEIQTDPLPPAYLQNRSLATAPRRRRGTWAQFDFPVPVRFWQLSENVVSQVLPASGGGPTATITTSNVHHQ